MKKPSIALALLFGPALLAQRGLDPADLVKPLSDQWTSYSGDYTGKRYSALKQINTTTVKNLSLKWLATGITTGCGATGTAAANAGGGGRAGGGAGFDPAMGDGGGMGGPGGGGGGGGRGGRGGGGGPAAPIIVGGFGTGDVNNCGPARLGGGILYV